MIENRNRKVEIRRLVPACVGAIFLLLVMSVPVYSQEAADNAPAASEGAPVSNVVPVSLGPKKPIVIDVQTDPLEERLQRMITLDVRQMNLVDVLKFLSLKGDFNLVTSSQVAGRVTLNLKNVKIGDALDITLISNAMAYYVEKNIVYVMSEIEYEAMFGKKFNDKNIVDIIQLKYAKPGYVLAALDNLKSNLGKVIIDEDTGSVVMIDTPETIARMKAAVQEIEKPLETVVITLQYAKADVVAEKLKLRIDANSVGSIETDERTNRLIVRAFPHRRNEVEALIKSLDTPTKEVLVEARVLQVVFNPKQDYGIDWQLDFRNAKQQILRRTSFQNIFLDEDDLATSSNLLNNFTKVGIGNFDVNQFETAIRALKQVSTTKLLSNPRILVTNNQEARIHVGDTIPYIISTTSGTGDNAITSEEVRFVDVGIKLNVTPTINDDDFVTMVLKPEISSVTGSITSQGGGIPQVNKTEVETTVMVKDGMSVVLGGLKKENKVHSKKGFPVLMDIPYLGKLFSAESESIESTEIVIFITPHIITGNEGVDDYRGIIKPAQGMSRDKKQDDKKQALRLKQ